MQPKRLALLGATGSIGKQTIDVIRSLPDRYKIVALTAHKDTEGLSQLAREFPDAECLLSCNNQEGVAQLVRTCDAQLVVNGISGAAGLGPSIAALECGSDLALANKESIVMGFGLLSRTAQKNGTRIIPIDSEHAALFQLINRLGSGCIQEIIITASGGALRDRPIAELADVTPDEASRHPNWSMGRKITIDSASMANKGLEVIEAVRLFGFSPEKVKVLVHPQSYVHALVRTTDGSLYAQISAPDMRVPIQNALLWPEELPCTWGNLDLAGKKLEFMNPDPARYPVLPLAYKAANLGEGATIAYNAADEIAVAAFENLQIRFTQIASVIATTIDRPWPTRLETEGDIFDIDRQARSAATRAAMELSC